MSTKNLARTVIEGGRYKSNKWDRRNSHAESRAREKNYMKEVEADPENWYDYDFEPTEPVHQGFRDKLGPMYRWLSAQVGRLWNDVRSDVAKNFDIRTTAGRHITYDHLLSSVEVTPDYRYGRYRTQLEDPNTSHYRHDFYVDDDGYLRERTYIPYKTKQPKFDGNKIANWLSGRCVGYVGNKAFWFVPTGKGKKYHGYRFKWKTLWGYPPSRSYFAYHYNRSQLRFLYLAQELIYKTDEKGHLVYDENDKKILERVDEVWKDHSPVFRQDRKLNDKELAFWNSIPANYQKIVLKYSPTYVKTAEDIASEKRYGY